MSNRAKLFCAAVFVVLATVTSSARADWNKIAYQHFSLEKDCIAKRLELISRLIKDLEEQPLIEIFPQLIKQLKQNMTVLVDEARLMVDYRMNNPRNKFVFNRTECKRFVDEYEKEIDDVETRLDVRSGNAFVETIRRLTGLMSAIKNELETVENVEPEARACEGFSCNKFVDIAKAAKRKVYEHTAQFSCSKTKYSTYVEILLEMEYDAFVRKFSDVLMKTEMCMRGGNLSTQNHF